jgi:hypothetical protein
VDVTYEIFTLRLHFITRYHTFCYLEETEFAILTDQENYREAGREREREGGEWRGYGVW